LTALVDGASLGIMGYVDSNLPPDESVTYRTSLHWAIFLGPIFCLAVAAAFFICAAAMNMGVIAIFGFSRWPTYLSSEFAITDKRVVIIVGLLRRHTLEMLLTKVETIAVDQGIVGRIFNFGTIVVIGTGGTRERFTGISSPLEFRRQVQGGSGR
jgi:uncharacterized membrane protein YdbT with pleckstrin-like domain